MSVSNRRHVRKFSVVDLFVIHLSVWICKKVPPGCLAAVSFEAWSVQEHFFSKDVFSTKNPNKLQ